MSNELENNEDKVNDSIFSETSPITGVENTNDTNNEESKLTNDEKLLKLEEQLQTFRNTWGDRIITLVKKIKNVELLKDAQVDMLSYRQMLVEQLIKFNVRLRKSETIYEQKYKNRFITYFNYDYKLNDKQKDSFVNADLAFYRRQISLLESQTDYYRECIKTLDQMGWAIKNRINIDKEF